MRLGQLARQLAISPDELVTYLANQEIALDSHPNTRLEDKHVEMILQHFAPGNEEMRQQVQELLPETAEPLELEPSEDAAPPEIIRAPKVELPGLRVVGKIDLPEKKKTEPRPEPVEGAKPEDAASPEASIEPASVERRRPERRPEAPEGRRYERRNQLPRDRKNPIAQQREEEERERRLKLEEAREKDKERRAEYYRKRLKPQAPTKAVRLNREEFEEMPPLEPEPPKTAWGKFMRWLTT